MSCVYFVAVCSLRKICPEIFENIKKIADTVKCAEIFRYLKQSVF